MSKQMLCPCEDVTLGEAQHAYEIGNRDIESLKRYTGLGTGMCQGKSCLAGATQLIAKLSGGVSTALAPFHGRAPTFPTSLSSWATLDPERFSDDLPLLASEPPILPTSALPLPEHADVVIIGGGIMGLGLAYQLTQRGVSRVVVLERSYLNAGASGRNGGGVRAQWSTPSLIRLGKRSLELCDNFATELGINVWFRRGGYLFLAPDAVQARRLERHQSLHEREGLSTLLLSAGGAGELVPQLDTSRFELAAYNPDDGVVFPWPFLWGYAEAASQRGATISPFTEVTGLEVSGQLIRSVQTTRGRILCDRVINAAGAWSPAVAALARVALPNRPTRHEILTSEPLKPWLDPLVSVVGSGLYFSQSARGELVGGMGDPAEPAGLRLHGSLKFLARFARAATDVIPALGSVQVTRQWAGCYDVTPDNNPVLGAAGPGNFFQLSGFVGHGFMMAPAVTELYARWLTGGGSDEIFERFTLARFDKNPRGDPEREEFVIG